jgi:hypothetical protein
MNLPGSGGYVGGGGVDVVVVGLDVVTSSAVDDDDTVISGNNVFETLKSINLRPQAVTLIKLYDSFVDACFVTLSTNIGLRQSTT